MPETDTGQRKGEGGQRCFVKCMTYIFLLRVQCELVLFQINDLVVFTAETRSTPRIAEKDDAQSLRSSAVSVYPGDFCRGDSAVETIVSKNTMIVFGEGTSHQSRCRDPWR